MPDAAIIRARWALVLAAATPSHARADASSAGINDARRENAVGLVVEPAARSAPLWHACAAPGTDPSYLDAVLTLFTTSADPHDPSRYFLNTRWTATALVGNATGTFGDRLTLTYSFPSDGATINQPGVSGVNTMHQRLTDWFGSPSAGKAIIRQCMDRWEQVSGLRFLEVADDGAAWGLPGAAGARGDIRIVAVTIDGPLGVLALAAGPNNGDIVIDASEDFSRNPGDNFLYFRQTITHEIGHSWGALHVCPASGTKLMEPFLSLLYDGPRHDDIRAAQFGYGDAFNPNSSSAAATPLGTVAFAPLTVANVSVLGASEDWYAVTVPIRSFLSAVVAPDGFVYDSTPQVGPVCGSGNVIDSAAVTRLGVTILGPDGVTVLGDASASASGMRAAVAPVIVNPGTYFIRTRGFIGAFATQLYRLTLRAPQAVCPGDANADGRVDFLDLNIVLSVYGVSGPALQGDLNGDGVTDFLDLNFVLSAYGTSC